MKIISARNVNDAWALAKILLSNTHVVRPSRVGEVWEYPEPVTTHYWRPLERVLFDPLRNCNPVFHFMEGLWMLAGRNDVKWISWFNQRMKEFSDDGVQFHGAYGYRWRRHFDMDGGAEEDFPDQLSKVVRLLRNNHDERRAVLQMWDPVADLDRPGYKDLPCNLSACFKIRDGKLTMTVMCRSNDIVWGCYGANSVHMSMMMEYVAARVGVPVGSYWQISDSWHAYTERWDKYGGNNFAVPVDPYAEEMVVRPDSVTFGLKPYPMVDDSGTWDSDLQNWMEDPMCRSVTNGFFPRVATPLLVAWNQYKRKNFEEAAMAASECAAADWRLAAVRWIARNASRTSALPLQQKEGETLDAI